MKQIPLTRGNVALVDDADFAWLSKWKWHAFRGTANRTFYACRTEKSGGKKRTVWMHREINQTPDDMVTDHINGNGLDNRRGNLRSATHAENMINNDRHVRTDKPRGVSWHKSNRCWIAQITIDRRNIYLGRFDNPVDAARAYELRRAELRAGQIFKE